jgi:glycosyltransferase involved in cell wall biosynthesis
MPGESVTMRRLVYVRNQPRFSKWAATWKLELPFMLGTPMRFHVVYPCSDSISCPSAIGRHIRDCLAPLGPVIVHDFNANYTIESKPDDILIGSPGWEPWHIFNRSVKKPGWKRRIGIQPFCPGDPKLQAATDRIIPYCDQFLAICGSWWFQRTPESLFSHWSPKLKHLDLAVDRKDFPRIKSDFAPPGQRRFVYIGHSAWYKQPKYLCALAKARPGWISWIGKMRSRYSGPARLGVRDFSKREAQDELRQFDFLLTVGNADANPTTILEAMAWGLVPVATPESGYGDVASVLPIQGNDLVAAIKTLDEIQYMSDALLKVTQSKNDQLLENHYNWDRFCSQIVSAVTANDHLPLGQQTWQNWLRMRTWEIRSPYTWMRPRPIRHWLCKQILAPFKHRA